jgi:hypothetical protein
MTKRVHKSSDGKYHVKGKVHEVLVGSRAQVWHGTAHKTSGGLEKHNLMMNKHGRIVSRTKHGTAKREKRLEKHGFFAKKGKFGMVRRDTHSSHKSHKRRGSHKHRRSHKRR